MQRDVLLGGETPVIRKELDHLQDRQVNAYTINPALTSQAAKLF
jgi:hypothetical protein